MTNRHSLCTHRHTPHTRPNKYPDSPCKSLFFEVRVHRHTIETISCKAIFLLQNIPIVVNAVILFSRQKNRLSPVRFLETPTISRYLYQYCVSFLLRETVTTNHIQQTRALHTGRDEGPSKRLHANLNCNTILLDSFYDDVCIASGVGV